jgi:hypothetical protein
VFVALVYQHVKVSSLRSSICWLSDCYSISPHYLIVEKMY